MVNMRMLLAQALSAVNYVGVRSEMVDMQMVQDVKINLIDAIAEIDNEGKSETTYEFINGKGQVLTVEATSAVDAVDKVELMVNSVRDIGLPVEDTWKLVT